MGFYNSQGKWQYEPTDAGAGLCDEDDWLKQQREKQRKLDQNNAGEIGSPITSETDKEN